MPEDLEPEFTLSPDLLGELFSQELESFYQEPWTGPYSQRLELRAATVAWCAAFTPEYISAARRQRLRQIIKACRSRRNWRISGWYRMPYLDVAQFLLTGWFSELGNPIGNLSHHNSSLRSAIHTPLALALPQLSIEIPEVLNSIRMCFEQWHLDTEVMLCLFLGLSGAAEAKEKIIKEWRSEVRLSPQDEDLLDRFLHDGYVPNRAILPEFLGSTLYVCARLCDPSLRIPSAKQLDFGTAILGFDYRTPERQSKSQPADEDASEPVTFSQLWARVCKHPFAQGSLGLTSVPPHPPFRWSESQGDASEATAGD